MQKPAQTVIPFKGESLPVYVLHRVSSTRAPVSSPAQLLPPNLPTPTAPLTINTNQSDAQKSTITTTPPAIVSNNKPTTLLLKPSHATTPLKLQRPSLSEQLRSISNGAQSITTQLRASYDLPTHTCLLETTASHLSVGRLACRFPGPVQFTSEASCYLFHHPFETKEIHMKMYYRDMHSVEIHLHSCTLQFRIKKQLKQFGKDYDPSNSQHQLRIVFATTSETEKVKRFLASYQQLFATIS